MHRAMYWEVAVVTGTRAIELSSGLKNPCKPWGVVIWELSRFPSPSPHGACTMTTPLTTAAATILDFDLGKYKSVACLYRSAADTRFTTSRLELTRLLANHRPDVVLLGTCLLSGWVRDLGAELGVTCRDDHLPRPCEVTVGCASPASIALCGPRPPGRAKARVAEERSPPPLRPSFGNPARKMLPIAVPVDNNVTCHHEPYDGSAVGPCSRMALPPLALARNCLAVRSQYGVP